MKILLQIILLQIVLLFTQACSDNAASDYVVLESISDDSTDGAYLVTERTLQIDVIGHYSDDNNKSLNESLEWSSSDESIATVENGSITALDKEANVTIRYETIDKLSNGEAIFSKDISIRVVNATLKSIDINTSEIDKFYIGQIKELVAIGKYENDITGVITNDCNWSSSDKTIVTVDTNGTLKAISEGDAIITAIDSASSIQKTVDVTILASIYTEINISATESIFNVEQTIQFTALGTNTNGDIIVITNDVTWSSDNNDSVSIDSSGLATAKVVGSALITASLDSATYNSIELKVEKDKYLQLSDSINTKLEFPYRSYKYVSKPTADVYITIDTFTLKAVGKEFTISDLKVTDFNLTEITTAQFNGLEDTKVIKAGNTVTFQLESEKSDNVAKELIYHFSVDDGVSSFQVYYEFNTTD